MSPLRPLAARLQQLVDRIDPHAGRYRMLFESSPLPMWVLDDQSLRFLAVNDAAVRLYGYSREEFLAMSVGELRRPDERRDFLRNEAGGSVYRGLFRHAKKTGEPLDIDGVG
ncbi:MAG TPA: PAS domain-containing protein, partial [Burkholderiales bacterium]